MKPDENDRTVQNTQLSEDDHNKAMGLMAAGDEIDTIVSRLRNFADQYIQRSTGGREVALAVTNLQQARMWLEEAAKLITRGF